MAIIDDVKVYIKSSEHVRVRLEYDDPEAGPHIDRLKRELFIVAETNVKINTLGLITVRIERVNRIRRETSEKLRGGFNPPSATETAKEVINDGCVGHTLKGGEQTAIGDLGFFRRLKIPIEGVKEKAKAFMFRYRSHSQFNSSSALFVSDTVAVSPQLLGIIPRDLVDFQNETRYGSKLLHERALTLPCLLHG
ncbi:MAG: hypothetical protein M1827_003608 [Pycnora praestabilis]|nr:MAG: hypothetical protein M1827_003608 [Pycnora praestabilis]